MFLADTAIIFVIFPAFFAPLKISSTEGNARHLADGYYFVTVDFLHLIGRRGSRELEKLIASYQYDKFGTDRL